MNELCIHIETLFIYVEIQYPHIIIYSFFDSSLLGEGMQQTSLHIFPLVMALYGVYINLNDSNTSQYLVY